MPLSKERNKERMREIRLHKRLSPPQGINPVQPTTLVDDLNIQEEALDPIHNPSQYVKLDADGNIIPEVW